MRKSIRAARPPFILPRWLMIVVLVNIVSIIGFLVLLPDGGSRPAQHKPKKQLNPIYFCWSGISKEFSHLNYAALESTLLFHPTRPVILLSGAPVSVLEHLELNISLIYNPSVNSTSPFACLRATLSNLVKTGGSLFSLEVIWTQSSDHLPTLFLPIQKNRTMCRPSEGPICLSADSPLLLLNIPPSHEPAQKMLQSLLSKDHQINCSDSFADNTRLAIVHHLSPDWLLQKKDFNISRSIAYAVYPSSRSAALDFVRGTAEVYKKRIVAPKWLSLHEPTPSPLSGIRVVLDSDKPISVCLHLSMTTPAFIRGSDSQPPLKSLKFCGSALSINQNLTDVYVRITPESGTTGREVLSLSLRVKDLQTTVSLPVYYSPLLVTVVSKTFGREDALVALVDSVREGLGSSVHIVTGDDSLREMKRLARLTSADANLSFQKLDFDIGLSAGRNTLLKSVETPYVFLIDDDFLVDSNLNLGLLLYILETGQFDILAVRNPADFVRWGFDFAGKLVRNESVLSLESGSYGNVDGCQIVDIVPNLFLASVKFLKEVAWDPRLKLAEHEEYFLRVHAAGGKVGTCSLSWVCHQWHSSEEYETDRKRQQRFFRIALRKHDLTKLVSFGGLVVAQIDPTEAVDLDEQICPLGFVSSWRGCTSCATGFEGSTCDQCSPGFWGADCQPCDCNSSPCSDGRNGTGCVCAADRHGLHCEVQFPVGQELIVSPIGPSRQNGSQLNRPWFGLEGGYTVVREELQGEEIFAPLVSGVPGGAVAQVVELNQTKPRRVVVSAFSKPLNVSYGPPAWYGLWVDCWYKDNEFEWGMHVSFQANRRVWQYRELILDLHRTITTITVLGMLKQHKGTAVFANISVREEAG